MPPITSRATQTVVDRKPAPPWTVAGETDGATRGQAKWTGRDRMRSNSTTRCVRREQRPLKSQKIEYAAEGGGPQPPSTVRLLLRLVDQTGARWNRLTGWLRRVEALRAAA